MDRQEVVLDIHRFMPELQGITIPEVVNHLRNGEYQGGRADAVIRHIVASGYQLTPADMGWMGEQIPGGSENQFFAEVFALRGYRFSVEQLVRFNNRLRHGFLVAQAQALAGQVFSKKELLRIDFWDTITSNIGEGWSIKDSMKYFENRQRGLANRHFICLDSGPSFGWEFRTTHMPAKYFASKTMNITWGDVIHDLGIFGNTFSIAISGTAAHLTSAPAETRDYRYFVQMLAVNQVVENLQSIVSSGASICDISHLTRFLYKLFVEQDCWIEFGQERREIGKPFPHPADPQPSA